MSGKLEIFSFEADFHVSRLSGVLGDVLMAGMVSLGSEGPQFKFRFAVELRLGGVDSACHPSEVGKRLSFFIFFEGPSVPTMRFVAKSS